jgi:hypothetical protein
MLSSIASLELLIYSHFVFIKVEAAIIDKDPITDVIFKGHTFVSHISMKTIDNCFKA